MGLSGSLWSKRSVTWSDGATESLCIHLENSEFRISRNCFVGGLQGC